MKVEFPYWRAIFARDRLQVNPRSALRSLGGHGSVLVGAESAHLPAVAESKREVILAIRLVHPTFRFLGGLRNCLKQCDYPLAHPLRLSDNQIVHN